MLPKKNSILWCESSLIHILQKDKIADQISSVNQALSVQFSCILYTMPECQKFQNRTFLIILQSFKYKKYTYSYDFN
jgi:hypothetical protein